MSVPAVEGAVYMFSEILPSSADNIISKAGIVPAEAPVLSLNSVDKVLVAPVSMLSGSAVMFKTTQLVKVKSLLNTSVGWSLLPQ